MSIATYNGYDIENIHEKFRVSEDFRSFKFSCNFLILKENEGDLITECEAAEEKLSEINKDLSVDLGSTTQYNFSHASSTGFLARPRIAKVVNKVATGISRMYNFSIEIQLPMTQYDFRRSGAFVVRFAPTRQKIVSFAVEYTAGSSKTALQNYEDGSGGARAWAAGILSGLGGTWEVISETRNEEQESKTISATLLYKEILFDQADGVTDHPKIIDCRARYSVNYEQKKGISPSTQFNATPRVMVTIAYSAQIDREQESDPLNLEGIYQNTVKPYLINQAHVMLGLNDYRQTGRGYIVDQERKTIDPYSYMITGTISFLAHGTGAIILFLTERIVKTTQSGITDTPIWDGRDDTYNSWGIGGSTILTRTVTITQLYFQPKAIPDYGAKGGENWSKRGKTETIQRMNWGSGTQVAGTTTREVAAYSATFQDNYILINPITLPVTTIIFQG